MERNLSPMSFLMMRMTSSALALFVVNAKTWRILGYLPTGTMEQACLRHQS